MLAQENEYLQEVVSGVRQLTEKEKIRQQCQAREDYIYWERIRKAKYESDIQEQKQTISEQANTINEQANTINEQAEALSQKEQEIAHLRALLKQNDIKS